jgi:hypothetical protein
VARRGAKRISYTVLVGKRERYRPIGKNKVYMDEIKKVKESRNRPGVAQRVPGGLGSQIS